MENTKETAGQMPDESPAASTDKSADIATEQLRRELEELRSREKALNDMLAADPRSGVFLNNWRNGSDPVVELVRQFGMEIRQALDSPEMHERIEQANRDYMQRIADEKALAKEFADNMARSLEMLDDKCEREQIDDATVERAWEWLRKVTDEGLRGIVSDDTMAMAIKAVNHDADVATADRDGELRGRNATIASHLRRIEAADGTLAAHSGGGTLTVGAPKRPPMGVLDVMDRFRSVWD